MVVNQLNFTFRFLLAKAGWKLTANPLCSFQPESKSFLKLVKIFINHVWRNMDSTKISELHPVEILILVFLAVFEAIVTLCTITPRLWKSKDSVQTAQLKKPNASLKSSMSAPEESQPQLTSTLTVPLKEQKESSSQGIPLKRTASSRRSRQSKEPRKSTQDGANIKEVQSLSSSQI